MDKGSVLVIDGRKDEPIIMADELDEIAAGIRGAAMAIYHATRSEASDAGEAEDAWCTFMTESLERYAGRLEELGDAISGR